MIRFYFFIFLILALNVSAQSNHQTANKVSILPEKKIELFDGKGLSDWTFVTTDPKVILDSVWSVNKGVVECQGKPNGYIRTVLSYHDYQLHLEWCFPTGPGNSGVFLHSNGPDKVWPNCFEVQLLSGKAGDIRCNGGSLVQELTTDSPKAVPHSQSSTEKPVGEWNSCDVVCRGNTITVRINSVLQNQVTRTSANSGSIALQAEGKLVEFRNLYLEPLPLK
ncbi:3-keto-disaccharide hydrolase [Flavobacterium luteum]|uniref:DUF1080 domain-containing protein n=1 Tax=Flavobacterium luteum TaxID=2026654 RepID=A0A7J5A8X5_9FLAO|nr:DUF1080 domain-containing protein [Flavobacterium luteum]KAB1154031.1 DUF1080 domain-containing protein [Flavobacterium luteum]